MYCLADYDYDLPDSLIAQKPVPGRDRSRLLRLDRSTGKTAHYHFYHIGQFFEPGDVLVVNNTRVIPARLFGHKSTGGKVEVLILDFAGGQADGDRFTSSCLVKTSKAPRPGTLLIFPLGLRAEVLDGRNGTYTLQFQCREHFEDILEKVGFTPLPPYIKRPDTTDPQSDRVTYQTVYAAEKGAIAAPTAGLHFSEQLLAELTDHGVEIARITLHVGYGTFMPVRVEDIRQHRMHFERFVLTPAAAQRINQAKARGRRVIAVGTTCVRTLEFAAGPAGTVHGDAGRCDLFIYPGYQFKVVDGLITNFHLPRSTLMMLVSAFAGRENILNAYRDAIEQKYRFYSYGDAMIII